MHRSTPKRTRLARTVVGSAVVLALATAPAAFAKDVAGNNGTVKIHDGPGETSPVTHNDPHVGCDFHLHFMFGDDVQSGDWEIRSWSPTGNRAVVDDGMYATGVDGEDRQDASVPAAGHYKLFWAGDTDKHAKQKVFWSDCEGGSDNGGGDGENVDQ